MSVPLRFFSHSHGKQKALNDRATPKSCGATPFLMHAVKFQENKLGCALLLHYL